jgi:hypothetical protein
MEIRLKILLFLFALLLVTTSKTALAGRPDRIPQCLDARGNRVERIEDHRLDRIALAEIYRGRPIIRHNPDMLLSFSQGFRLWEYARECAHHQLGHVGRFQKDQRGHFPIEKEILADLRALDELRSLGYLSRHEIELLAQELERRLGLNWSWPERNKRSAAILQYISR